MKGAVWTTKTHRPQRETSPRSKDEIVEATKGDLATLKDEIVEVIRDSETKLLNAFYGYAKSNDNRVLETEANEAVLRSRVATLETRITEIEQRLNMPPQQTQ